MILYNVLSKVDWFRKMLFYLNKLVPYVGKHPFPPVFVHESLVQCNAWCHTLCKLFLYIKTWYCIAFSIEIWQCQKIDRVNIGIIVGYCWLWKDCGPCSSCKNSLLNLIGEHSLLYWRISKIITTLNVNILF